MIRRVNEDGSFKIEFDVKEMTIMPYWHGVTPAEISFDDAAHWKDVFARVCRDGHSFAEVDFASALSEMGYRLTPEKARSVWAQACQKLFGLSEDQAADHALDEESSYTLFLHLGVSAKQCAANLQPERPKPFFKLYWNQTRMGGREIAEIARRVTLADALAALGLKSDRVDHSTEAFLKQVEQDNANRLPRTLRELLRCEGAANAVTFCHPNNPNLIEFNRDEWKVQRGMRERQLSGDCAISIMVPHQGDHEWAVVFDDGEDDARVYVRCGEGDEESWLLTSPNVGMFFWDLAQTGLAWHQDTRYQGGKPVRRSDIGLELDV